MSFETDDEIEATARAMMACALPKEHWTHAAHFAVGLWLLRTRGAAAYAEMPGMIRRYNESVGGRNTDTEGYHETITRASLDAAAAALAAQDGAPLHGVLAAMMAGPCGRSDWILAHWSKDLLFSLEARRVWVAPDLAPFPPG
ncbi:MAG: hypothetical protein FP825_14080 [Hyphomonas sp.]|uniref:hypothetical protein n=1 Tax=Hyphomonas sp. TaxID=87 RepID=UPI00182249FC|nr:hypothetical protein [Hyphomonas sp.]MBA3069597.1 hypothetical protein [Hyphomonas sp.]MBU4063242.1 hypothetical protein [Alphaproteobacteria bacterium]MBU4164060.1 hypothetical protein [Alphaproteobacteria bacterium]MBU4569289.1 hypothetical protein [Alphaproteobacteria bacterium]